MGTIRNWRPSPSLAVSFVALFVALTGTALALEANSVRSIHIADGQVRTQDLADGAVRAPKVGAGAISRAKLRNGAVNSAKVADDSLSTADIALNGITSVDLTLESVLAEELGDVVARIDPTPAVVDGGAAGNGNWTAGASNARCEEGEQLLSGYGEWTDETDPAGSADALAIREVVPDPLVDQDVTVTGLNDTSEDHRLRAIALCLTAGP